MLNIDFTFLWTAVNLVVLYLFLNKYLFKRVGEFMDARSNAIENNMQKGEALKAEGEALRAEQVSLMESAAEKRRQILVDAQVKATKEHDEILAVAKKESVRILTSAHEEIENEREKMMVDLKDEVASLAIAAASKVIEANMDDEKNRKLVEEFLEKEGVA